MQNMTNTISHKSSLNAIPAQNEKNKLPPQASRSVRPISDYMPKLVHLAHYNRTAVIPISAFSNLSKPLSTNRTIAPLPSGPKPSPRARPITPNPQPTLPTDDLISAPLLFIAPPA